MVALSTRCDFPLAHSLARQDLPDGGLGEQIMQHHWRQSHLSLSSSSLGAWKEPDRRTGWGDESGTCHLYTVGFGYLDMQIRQTYAWLNSGQMRMHSLMYCLRYILKNLRRYNKYFKFCVTCIFPCLFKIDIHMYLFSAYLVKIDCW